MSTTAEGATLQFWFEFASTYSYPCALRIEDAARAAGVAIEWRPFLLGPIFAAQGWTTSPFNIYEAKGRYMWRDMERLAAKGGHVLVRPDPFPQNSLKAARLAIAADGETWQPSLCRGIFLAEFGEGRNIAEDDVLSEIVDDLGQDTGTWLGRIQDQAVKDRLRAQTEEAVAAGIFGAPSFTVGSELFWGNDRLEQALDLAAERA
jgi:2-hydroxychromene-2-carboxylate isomerase